MAPDKIYINNYNGNDTFGNQWHTKPSESPSVVSHEYIRKDALLEWVKEKEQNAITNLVKLTYKTVIDKIKSL